MILHSLLAILTVFCPASQATSFYIRPFSEFISTSNNIARGTISNIHVENGITSDGGKTIYTYANLEVKEALKGDINKPNIIIRKIGGSKDGYTLEIPSSPEFKEGEDTVLFLSEFKKEDSSYEVSGLELGKFGLEEKNGEETLTGGIFNYSKPGPAGHDEHAERAKDLSENEHPWTLTHLRAKIKEQSNEQPASSQPGIQASNVKETTHLNNSPDKKTGQILPSPQATETTHQSETPSETRNYLPYLAFAIAGALGIFLFLRRR